MSNETKLKQAKQVSLRLLLLFQCLQVNILKSGNVIPNSYHFCIMGSDRGSGKPRSWFKNQFLLDEGVLNFWF